MSLKLNYLGTLNKEITLVRADVSLLFIMKNENNKKFIFMCEDTIPLSYFVVAIDDEQIVELLESKITLYDFFYSSRERYWIEKLSDSWHVDIYKKPLTDDMMPDKGAVFGSLNEYLTDYVTNLKRNLENVYTIDFDLINCVYFCNWIGNRKKYDIKSWQKRNCRPLVNSSYRQECFV